MARYHYTRENENGVVLYLESEPAEDAMDVSDDAIWNEWQNAYLFITDDNLAPLQLLLIRIEKSIEYALHNSSEFTPQEFAELLRNLPQESCRMAMLFMVLGPILIAYPFFQKYFVKGLTVGAVKG